MSDASSTDAGAPTPDCAWRWTLLPVAVSLALSACTVGNKPHWQDSAIYLVAVKEFSVLYPPGFVLYLSLCKAWTLLLSPFADFTLAVHLFSSLCAALAAGFLARAAERLSGDRVAAAVIGCLAAAGYTWWFSGLYAKGYALYFMVVALLLWRMTCRDHVRVILLLGTAWAVHPSAALLAPAALVYLARYRAEILALGWRRLCGVAPAAILCAFGPSLFLPLIAARESVTSMGHPATFPEWITYVAGSRFTTIPGVWGFVGWRWTHVALYAWDEFLVIGGLLAAVGTARMCRDHRPECWGILAWMLPVIVVSALFKIEGQQDFWLVVAWMPLWLAAAVGLSSLRARAPWLPLVALAGGLLCSVGANGRDLYLRGEELPEMLGRSILKNLDPGATLVVSGDDAIGLCQYLQSVRGYRTDVRIVNANLVGPYAEYRWYQNALELRWPGVSAPDFDAVMLYRDRFTRLALTQGALVNGRKPGSPPVYFDMEPAGRLLNSGSLVPAGFLWKWTEKEGDRPNPPDWDYPVTLEDVARRRGRLRGVLVTYSDHGVWVHPQSYERRIVYFMAEARRTLADLLQREGSRTGYARSAEAYESILKSDPNFASQPRILYPLALDYYLLDRINDAAPMFQRVVDLDAGPLMKSGALFYLGEIHLGARRREEARDYYRRALEIAPAESPLREELEKRLR